MTWHFHKTVQQSAKKTSFVVSHKESRRLPQMKLSSPTTHVVVGDEGPGRENDDDQDARTTTTDEIGFLMFSSCFDIART